MKVHPGEPSHRYGTKKANSAAQKKLFAKDLEPFFTLGCRPNWAIALTGRVNQKTFFSQKGWYY